MTSRTFGICNAMACLAVGAAMAASSPTGGGVFPPGEAFQDVKLLPSGIDDTYHGCWTRPRRLDEEVAACPPTCGEGAMPWFDVPYADEEAAISLHWIWAARRMYASVRSDSEDALRALAEWDAAKTPPLLLFCVQRRVGDMSWHPILFALSRDGRWMLCPDEPSIWPDGGDWNGWRLLSIPEWRRARIQRLLFELPDQKSVLDQYRKWPASAAYSPFANGLAETERIAAKGYNIAFAPRAALAPGALEAKVERRVAGATGLGSRFGGGA